MRGPDTSNLSRKLPGIPRLGTRGDDVIALAGGVAHLRIRFAASVCEGCDGDGEERYESFHL